MVISGPQWSPGSELLEAGGSRGTEERAVWQQAPRSRKAAGDGRTCRPLEKAPGLEAIRTVQEAPAYRIVTYINGS